MPLRLSVVRDYAVILSAVAVPLLVAGFGIHQQRITAEQTLAKDYVQIAVSLLQQASDPDLKPWATEVLAKYAPVPLGPALKTRFANGTLTLPQVVLTDEHGNAITDEHGNRLLGSPGPPH